MKLPEVIGIAGTISSGKDSLAEFFVEKYGYNHVSTGDMVRAEAMKRFGNVERSTLQIVGPALRAEGGGGVLVEKALQEKRPVIVGGIRAIGEVKTLQKAGGVLLFIDANAKIRYNRMKKRARKDDLGGKITFEEFVDNEQNEVSAGNNDEDYNQVAIQNMADKTINNSGDPETLYKVALDYLSQLQ